MGLLRSDIDRLLDGDLDLNRAASSAARLGTAAREIHVALAAIGSAPVRRPERVAWFTDGQDLLSRALELTAGRAEGALLERWAPRLWLTMAAHGVKAVGPVQPVHGDFHLGQILRSKDGRYWVIDFEGEPDRPLAERLCWRSPVWDVATMLRSFANSSPMVARRRAADPAVLQSFVAEARAAFLDSYGPVDPALLLAFEAAKACHEVAYASVYLPEWFDVAWRSLEALAESVGAR